MFLKNGMPNYSSPPSLGFSLHGHINLSFINYIDITYFFFVYWTWTSYNRCSF